MSFLVKGTLNSLKIKVAVPLNINIKGLSTYIKTNMGLIICTAIASGATIASLLGIKSANSINIPVIIRNDTILPIMAAFPASPGIHFPIKSVTHGPAILSPIIPPNIAIAFIPI